MNLSNSEKYEKRPGILYSYGTAGFRMTAELLDSVMYRMGILAALRAKEKGVTIGVMVTASHNPEEDNGVKLVDQTGEMLHHSWEAYATEIANSDNLKITIEKIINECSINLNNNTYATVVYARDTRSSGPRLIKALEDGIDAIPNCLKKDFSELTTPQLHFIVRAMNENKSSTENDYFTLMTLAFDKIVGSKNSSPLVVDCANGVGALKLPKLVQASKARLDIKIVNDSCNHHNLLNYKCGADFVKVEQKPPTGIEQKPKHRYASLDGDADRIVFYYIDECQVFHLLDGDKIAALAALFFKNLISKVKDLDNINIGVVQTAYANGSSTKFFEKNNIPVAFTQTGVKHLHHKASEFDIGIYFEANGHGTILFHPRTIETLKRLSAQKSNKEEIETINILLSFLDLINQCVGDALSDLLLVEAILRYSSMSFEDWDSLYTDLFSRQQKVKVKDRNIIQTTDADRVVVTPNGVQEAINNLVNNYPNARCFVRPSGTEDVVRVYAEAQTREECDLLANQVSMLVWELCQGVGEKPTK
jgi:phosphoacetylglucosamine mutase